MSSRIYKGRLILTGDIDEENRRVFPEARKGFSEQPREDLPSAFHILYEILQNVCEGKDGRDVELVDGHIWVSGPDAWVRISPNGDVEIGEGAA